MPGMSPLGLGDLPEGYTELDDGSIQIPPEEGEGLPEGGEFGDNLTDFLPKDFLNKTARDLCDLIEKDRDARKKRDEQYTDGLRRSGLGDDAPGGAQFQGASRVVHPILAEVSIDFAASAMKELFPPSGPVKTAVIGDAPEEQLERAERKRTYLNWQLTIQMKEYRDELEQLLTQLPMGGSQFQKFWWDERLRRPVSEFVPIDDIFLPFASTNFYSSPRVTHCLHLTAFEFMRRVESGLYAELDVMNPQDPMKSDTAEANEKIEGKEDPAYNDDGVRDFYEVYVWQEVEQDTFSQGEYAPYVITIDVFTEKVVGFYRNWDPQDQLMEKLDWIIEWKFIPWRGAYAVGLPHLIGGVSAALTGALRALLDSAHIANAPSLMKLKAGRVVGQNQNIDVTQVTEIEGPAAVDDIRKLLMPVPFNGPSPVLFQLLGFLTEVGKGVAATAEEKISDASNQMPVGTALALIEQGSKVFSSIHARLHESQKRAIGVICRINRTFLNEQEEVQDLGKLVVGRQDFIGTMDVIPVSDPNIFSEAQRYAQMQGIMQLRAAAPQLPYNDMELHRRMLRLMHVDDPDKLLPPPPQPVSADPVTENFAAMMGQQLLAQQQQDHMAHMHTHLGFIFMNEPLAIANGVGLGAILTNVAQHFNHWYQNGIQQEVQMIQQQQQMMAQQQQMFTEDPSMMSGGLGMPPQQPQIPSDQLMAAGQNAFLQKNQQMMQQMIQMIQKADQIVKAKTPPPPMPPEVQASVQIAQMENQRKTQLDQATLGLKTQQQQGAQQMDAMRMQADQQAAQAEQSRKQMIDSFKMQLEAAQQQFDQMIEQIRVQNEASHNQLTQQVEMMKNDSDNKQHQMTELLKNHEDNQTNILIAQIREQVQAAVKQSIAEVQAQGGVQSAENADLAPQLKQMTEMLDRIHKEKTNEGMTAMIDGLRAAVVELGRPKTRTLIRGKDGKATGIREE